MKQIRDMTDAEFEAYLQSRIRAERTQKAHDDAKAVVDLIDSTPIVREVTSGIVSVLSIFLS